MLGVNNLFLQVVFTAVLQIKRGTKSQKQLGLYRMRKWK